MLLINLAALNELKAAVYRGGIKLARSVLKRGLNYTGLRFLPLLLLVLVKDYLGGFPWQEASLCVSVRLAILVGVS
jgi:hypothetical protein